MMIREYKRSFDNDRNGAKQVKVLNLYSGCGGNRKNWDNCEVVAVKKDPEIAEIYSHFFPDDTVIVGDAHAYLLSNYNNFDFIWSSPPCPSHSKIREMGVKKGLYPALYPDVKLWEEVTLLKHFAKYKWVVENVEVYYEPIIAPTFKLGRHFFWSNFQVTKVSIKGRGVAHKQIKGANHIIYGFDISSFKAKDKRRILRNMVSPEVGSHIFKTATDSIKLYCQGEQLSLFSTGQA